MEIRVLLKFAEKFSAYRKRYGIFSAKFAEKRLEYLRMRKEAEGGQETLQEKYYLKIINKNVAYFVVMW